MEPNPAFLPPDESRYIFAGSDPEAISGQEDSAEGYAGHIGIPAGIYLKTNMEGFGAMNFSDELLLNEDFRSCMIFLALDLDGEERLILTGTYDRHIRNLGNWIAATGRPVLITQEQSDEDGLSGKAFRAIIRRLKETGMSNLACVWNTGDGFRSSEDLRSAFPGQDYVDWIAFDLDYPGFGTTGKGAMELAKELGVPVIVNPAAPGKSFLGARSDDSLWNGWYVPLTAYLEEKRQIKAFVLDNSVEESLRITSSETLIENWKNLLSRPGWIHGRLVDYKEQ